MQWAPEERGASVLRALPAGGSGPGILDPGTSGSQMHLGSHRQACAPLGDECPETRQDLGGGSVWGTTVLPASPLLAARAVALAMAFCLLESHSLCSICLKKREGRRKLVTRWTRHHWNSCSEHLLFPAVGSSHCGVVCDASVPSSRAPAGAPQSGRSLCYSGAGVVLKEAHRPRCEMKDSLGLPVMCPVLK